MRKIAALVPAISIAVLLANCAAPPSGRTSGQTTDQTPVSPQRTLVIIARGEPPSLAAKPLVGYSGSLNPPLRLFNATLDELDENDVSHPYLEQELPRLNTDSWRVAPDGTMETTHILRPNLTWHDGQVLTADDFVFGWQVFATPELGAGGTKPIKQMAEVVAKDPRTVVIRWRQPFPEADQLDTSFQPLPRHLLQRSYDQGDWSAFVNDSFWTTDYIGLGPYKVGTWEAGDYLEADAFAGHALGRPKIDRVKLEFVSDSNTALAKMLSGEAQYVADYVLGHQDGATLDEQWAGDNAGTVVFAPVLFRFTQIQLRPEYADPKAVLDVRFRRALAHAFDTPGAVEAFTGSKGLITYSLSWPKADYYPEIQKAITERKYDPRRAQQLLEEFGLERGADGFYAGSNGEPLQIDLWNTGGTFERENRVFADSLRKAGIDANPRTLGPARLRDEKARALIGGLFTGGLGSDRLTPFTSNSIPRPENHWTGTNRGGWSNPDYDRFWQAWNTTLAPSERIQDIAQMEHILNADVGIIPHYFTDVVTAWSSQLKGPVARTSPDAPAEIYRIETWEWGS